MKRVLREWLSGLLSVVLLLTLLPATALAEEADGTAEHITVQEIQALIDALPDAESITADNRADVEAQLTAIDEAKLALEDEELDALDITRYDAAVATLSALDGQAEDDEPTPMTDSGNINGFEWSLDDRGILTIIGSGELNVLSGFGPDTSVPWDKNSVQVVIIRGDVTAIGDYAFMEHENLRQILLPEGLTTIGEGAFDGCRALALTELPAGVTAIEDNTFASCHNLALTKLPEGLTTIGNNAFDGCDSLTLESIPEGVTSIGDFAFLTCDSLTHLTLPESLNSMGLYVFQGCYNLTSLTFKGSTAPNVDSSTFKNAYGLQEILISDGATGYDAAHGWPEEKVKTGYNVTVQTAANGAASAAPAYAASGTKIDLTANPEEGYHLKEWQTQPNDEEYAVIYTNPTGLTDLPADPVKEGYTFEGWSTSQRGSVDFTTDTPVNSDITVYAVFKGAGQKIDGTGSVTMADYTCGDNSVEPVAVSSTNGTDHVTYYYKVRGAADSTYSTTKPSTAGEYTVKAVFAATDDYNAVTATADFKITHDYPDNWDGSSFECSCKRDLRLEVSYLTEVPEGLKGIESLDTVEEIRRVLVEAVSTGANSAVYDIRLEVMDASGRWVEATDETFPTEGIHIVLPYPAGSDSGCTFTVVHMFASGSRAGETETPAVTNTAEGIAFSVTGLSPVCVGWTYPYHAGTGSAAPSTPHYGVTTPPATSGGGVSVSPKSAQPGTKVTVTVTPEVGHHLGALTVKDSAGRAVEVTDNGDGTYTFTMPYGQVSVSTSFVECSSLNFTDLNTTAWYHAYTDYVLANGLMHGKGNNRFAPEGTVTRAEMVTTLWNLRGKPVVNYYMTYSDVNEESWYSEAVRWASSEGIAQGYGNGKFGPNDAITREQMAVMLYRYEQKYGSGGFTGAWMYLMPFDDLQSISDWAFEAVAWCNMRGIIEGKSGNVFDPKGLARRSELAAVLTRYDTAD